MAAVGEEGVWEPMLEWTSRRSARIESLKFAISLLKEVKLRVNSARALSLSRRSRRASGGGDSG